MNELSERQRATRSRFERGIRLAAPFLDVVLAVGERISRIAEPVDYDYYPVREGDRSPSRSTTRGGGSPA